MVDEGEFREGPKRRLSTGGRGALTQRTQMTLKNGAGVKLRQDPEKLRQDPEKTVHWWDSGAQPQNSEYPEKCLSMCGEDRTQKSLSNVRLSRLTTIIQRRLR